MQKQWEGCKEKGCSHEQRWWLWVINSSGGSPACDSLRLSSGQVCLMCLRMSPAAMCTWVGMINEVLDEKWERQMCLAVASSSTELWLCLMNACLMLQLLFAGDEEEDGIERTCDTLLMCIVTVLNQGLRNGGGVGDVLRKPSKDVSVLAEQMHYSLCISSMPKSIFGGYRQCLYLV